MKKIILVFLFIATAFTLISCGSKHTFSFDLNVQTELRNKVVFSYEIKDENSELVNSEISYAISKKGSDSVLKSGTVSKTSTELTVSSLEEATSYTITVTTTYNNNSITLIDAKEFNTSSLGTSEDNPYIITEASELRSMVVNDNVGYFRLDADLDLADITFEPFFTSSSSYFKGTFDGNGHTISNFHLGTPAKEATEEEEAQAAEKYKYTTSSSYLGMFGAIAEEGCVKNLTLDNVDLYVGRDSSSYFAVLAGYNAGKIQNVTVSNSVLHVETTTSNKHYVGVIAGKNLVNGLIEDCKVLNTNVIVSSRFYTVVGGICAINDAKEAATVSQNKILNAEFTGTITVDVLSTASTSSEVRVLVGGIIGQNNSYVNNAKVDAEISVSSSLVNYAGTKYSVCVGGVVGQNLLDGSSVVYGSNVNVKLDVICLDNVSLAVGLVAGQNGGTKEFSKAQVLNSTVASKGESSVTGRVNQTHIGVVGLDKSTTTTFNASEEITLNAFELDAADAEDTAREYNVKVNENSQETNVTKEIEESSEEE